MPALAAEEHSPALSHQEQASSAICASPVACSLVALLGAHATSSTDRPKRTAPGLESSAQNKAEEALRHDKNSIGDRGSAPSPPSPKRQPMPAQSAIPRHVARQSEEDRPETDSSQARRGRAERRDQAKDGAAARGSGAEVPHFNLSRYEDRFAGIGVNAQPRPGRRPSRWVVSIGSRSS